MTLPIDNYLRIKVLDLARRSDQFSAYNELLRNQYQADKDQIIKYQKAKFNDIFRFHFENNKIYKEHVLAEGYQDKPFVTVKDVPLIDKSFFRANLDSHYVSSEVNITKHSGGSTGVPLTVHLSKGSVDNFWPSIWRAFDVYGIKPCDKVMMIAGPSLFNNRSLKRRVYDYVNRFYVVSAFDLNDEKFRVTYETIINKKIKVIYGYTSSTYSFLQYLERKNLKVELSAIFTTSETFIPAIRQLAKIYCNCDVIDTYGANDGGVQGFECQYHCGYHLNYERCLVEIIDNEIILTDLQNTASPFIRYRVGDYTSSSKLITDTCSCGRSLFRIQEISGKISDFIEDLDGNKVHTQYFQLIFKTDVNIRRYQIIQKSNELLINIVHEGIKTDRYFVDRYTTEIQRRFKLHCKIVCNLPLKSLPNMKTPILIKEY